MQLNIRSESIERLRCNNQLNHFNLKLKLIIAIHTLLIELLNLRLTLFYFYKKYLITLIRVFAVKIWSSVIKRLR